ncbi:hypothetical protein [Bacteroides acidifaciens]|uniref:hypothetical protein n=1 Tax=Bacteroides acidifaciens TaxID=85831 RepID=UPI002557DD48|nr:hypothetical protein [Bacteroides acidifaciens]
MNRIKFVLFIGLLFGVTEKGLTQEHDWKKDNLKGIVVSVKETEYSAETKFGEHLRKDLISTKQIFYNERGVIRKKIEEEYTTYYLYNKNQKLIKETTVASTPSRVTLINTDETIEEVTIMDTISIKEYIYASDGKLIERNSYTKRKKEKADLTEKVKYSYSTTEAKILTYNADGSLVNREIIPINTKTDSPRQKDGCQYNKHGDIIKRSNFFYEYTYDNHQNWTIQKFYEHYYAEPSIIRWTEREYTYANTLEDLVDIVQKEEIEVQKQQQQSSLGYTFSGRTGSGFILPNNPECERGIVAVDVIVNPAGQVVGASINPHKTTITNTALINAIIEAAKKTHYNVVKSSRNQLITTIYNYRVL